MGKDAACGDGTTVAMETTTGVKDHQRHVSPVQCGPQSPHAVGELYYSITGILWYWHGSEEGVGRDG